MSVSHTIPMLQGGISIQAVMFTSYFHRIHGTNGIFTYYLLIYHENNPKLPRNTIKINELYHTWNPNDLYLRRDPTPQMQGQNSFGFQVNILFSDSHGSYGIVPGYKKLQVLCNTSHRSCLSHCTVWLKLSIPTWSPYNVRCGRKIYGRESLGTTVC